MLCAFVLPRLDQLNFYVKAMGSDPLNFSTSPDALPAANQVLCMAIREHCSTFDMIPGIFQKYCSQPEHRKCLL